MKRLWLPVLACVFCGCVGGPTKDHYNPIVIGARFKPPITMERVEDVAGEKEGLVREGYTVIGSTIYGGKHPEAVELKAQAKRSGANHVIYSSTFVPAQPGSWSFRFNSYGGWGGGGGGHHNVHIVFMGKP